MSEFVSTKKAPFLSAQMIAKVAVLGAFAFLVMMFEVPIPFFVSFYKLGFDEVVVMIGGFALGPLAAVMIEAIKILLNLLVNSTVTAGRRTVEFLGRMRLCHSGCDLLSAS